MCQTPVSKIKFISSITLIFTLCFLHCLCRGESNTAFSDYNVKLWQMEDGLPNNTVQAITQTQDGYLWIGTREGLARFDGMNFEHIDLLPGTPSVSISALHQSRNGDLWIGTDRFGLFKLSAAGIRRFPKPDGQYDYDVRELLEAGNNIWLTSSGEVLCLTNGRLHVQARLHRTLQGICVDDQGMVWTAAGDLSRLNGASPAGQKPLNAPLSSAARCIYFDTSEKTFWLGDEENLVQIKGAAVTTFPNLLHPSGYISTIFRDSAGQLWVGTYLGLSRLIDGKLMAQSPSNAPQYRIYAIFEDHEHNLWVGSEEGLSRLTPKVFKTITKADGLQVNTVVSVCAASDGSVWISPWGGGLNHWVKGNIALLNRTNGLSSDYIMALAEGHDGSLWAGADNGGALNQIKNNHITVYGQKDGFIVSASTATTTLFEDERGVLWIGSRDRLQCWDGKHFSQFATLDGMDHPKINAICGGSQGVVWIGTEGGLTRWQSGKFENLAAKDPRLKTLILSLYEDPAGRLWIGTKGNGLLEFKDGGVHEFTSAQGLFSDAIYAILEDSHNNLWLNSSHGIFRIDKQQFAEVVSGRQSKLISISYGKADGILSSGQYQEVTQPAACKSRDGRLWFRTTQGVAVVDPNQLNINKLPPPVVIQQVVANEYQGNNTIPYALPDNIVIPPGRGDLEVHYDALSFCAPEKCQFRYKLEGLDAHWVDVGSRRVAYYNNLRPGHYRFEVMACNNDGIWSQAQAVVSFDFKPHFWQTWWFATLLAVGSIGGISSLARYITKQRMQRKLEALARQNAVEKERTRIARDMHDELGAKLTKISFLGNTARMNSTNSQETNEQIGKMAEAARELILSLDQIVWAVDPENDSLENLANYICRYASEFTANSSVQCKFKIPLKLPPCSLSTDVRHNLFLTVKEALNNALKHSGATEIVIAISARAEEFKIAISDNGCGLDAVHETQPRPKRTGRGLVNMRERLKSIHGNFSAVSHPGQGTEISLTIPLNLDRASSKPAMIQRL
jgi:ligand-binding sensor domain-containing protein/signal transduction histidine kinase